MSANSQLGRFITSPAFAASARKATEDAVADLKARGFEPVIGNPRDKPVTASDTSPRNVVHRKIAHN